MGILMKSIICLLWMAESSLAFAPNTVMRTLASLNPGDSTHASITEAGIRRSVLAYYSEQTDGNNGSTSEGNQSSIISDILACIMKAGDITVCLSKSIGHQLAVQEIELANAETDVGEYGNRVDFHFDAERFEETNANIMAMTQYAKNNVSTNRNEDARIAIGHALHMIQDFYSHSNWVEMGRNEISPGLGNNQGFGVALAPREAATCRPCRYALGECKDNLIVTNVLTSGYYKSQSPIAQNTDGQGNIVEKPTDVAKCSHGGMIDRSAQADPIGGINKDTSDPTSSPHYHLHKPAANLAELATAQFITEFRKEIGNEKFESFLSLNEVQT